MESLDTYLPAYDFSDTVTYRSTRKVGDLAASLHTLGDGAAMQRGESALVLGFIGPIWRFNGPLHMPKAATFRAEAAADAKAAKVVWLVRAVPDGAGAKLRLDMRLQLPKDPLARRLCRLYWSLARRPSVWVRRALLQRIARTTTRD